jgi:nitroreductase
MDKRLDLLFGRRSIRSYRAGTMDDPTIRILLEAAMAAPSAVAKDPWRFVVVRKPASIATLAGFLSNGKMLLEAGTGIVVCGDIEIAHDRQLSYLLQDCSAAIQNILLAAHALGLGTCWLGVHPREERMQKVRDLLKLPAHVIPVGCVCVGVANETKEARTRFNPGHVHFEQW